MADQGVIRSIGGFTAAVTIEETGTDRLTVTKSPVGQGAAITDHSFKEPPTLTVRAGWSNSDVEAAGDPSYCTNIYAQLLALQNSRAPFSIVTGKRAYDNMLMTVLAETTAKETENALIVTMSFENIIIVQTQVTSVPPSSVQAQPQDTAATTSTGAQQLTSAPKANVSALSSVMDQPQQTGG